jgi:CheY-like chemotaxis protein
VAVILIADDQAEARLALRLLLEPRGYQVIEANEGGAALDVARQAAVDLFLCDVFMPGVDGLQAIRQFRAAFPALPIVAMSAGALGGRLDMLGVARLLGADRALAKPFTTEQLLEVFNELLRSAPPSGG